MATSFGIPGHDHELEDPSRAAGERWLAVLAGFQERLATIATVGAPIPATASRVRPRKGRRKGRRKVPPEKRR
jgi:hypothetical protein